MSSSATVVFLRRLFLALLGGTLSAALAGCAMASDVPVVPDPGQNTEWMTAAEKKLLLRAGDHYGLWHSDEAKFTVDSVDDNGKFSGHVELLDGLYKSATFDFTGTLRDDGSLVPKRTGCEQVSKAEAPESPGFHNVWRGKTYIADTKSRLLFELRVRNALPAEAANNSAQ